MRASGLDQFEQGDTWAKVCQFRPTNGNMPADAGDKFNAAVQRLMEADTRPDTAIRAGTLGHVNEWLIAFERAGKVIRTLANDGILTRGLRAVTAHHIIFHWNRIGLPYQTQANIAHAAKKALLDS